MIPKSIKMKLPSFLINFQFFIILSILFLFGLIPIGYSTATGISSSNSNEEEHLFRHRHHQHHQQQQQKHQLLPSSLHHYNNNHRLENVVDDFKKSQEEQKHKNITMINLRHHRTYIVEDADSNGNSILEKSTTESPILQFAPLSLDAVSALSTGKNHHLRHHNRHHQVWEQRVFPLLRHHPSTTNIMTTPISTPTTTSTDRSQSKKKFHYMNNFGGDGGRRRTHPTKSDFLKSDASNRKFNLTQKTSRYFDHDGFYNWNGFTTTTTTTRAPSLTKIWQSFDDDNKHFMKSSLRTFSDDNRFNLSDDVDDDDDDDDDSSVSEEGNSSNNNEEEEEHNNKDLIKKNKLQMQQKKNKSNLMNNKKLMNFRNFKKHDEYYEDDDDDEDDEESESIENDNDYNSNENSDDDDDDDLNISNESRNYVEQRILPKRKTFNMNSDDIYARSYKPGTLTQQKYEMLGTHEAVKQSRKLHITNQRHHKALATAHITKVTKEAACGIPKPRVERIQRETSKLYVPHCTILHRCGDDTGCCLSDSKTCVAKKTHDVALYFFVKSMNSNQGTIERLTFKNHTACHCVQKSKHNTNNLNLLMEPAMLRRATVLDCNCPKLFEKVLQDDGYCRCDCSSGNSNCDWLKRGMEHFSMVDRKCITEGRCKPPTCEFGSYVKKHGRCPKKDDKMSYSRNLH